MALLHLVAMMIVPIVVGAFVAFVLGRLAASAAARRAREALSSPPTVRGRLVAEGREGVTTFWRSRAPRRIVDGSVVRTLAAPRLVLATADGEVEIAGNVEVVAGSRVVWRGTQPFGDHYAYVADMALAPGDEVAAYGRVVEDAGGETDYRGKSTRRRLEPQTGRRAVRLVAVSPPRVRIAGAYRQGAVLFAALPFLWLPIRAAVDWSEVNTSGCADSGACGAVPTWHAKDAHMARVVKDWLRGHHYVSGARNDADCSASKTCVVDGACHVVGDQCEPGNEADCSASYSCAETGACSRVVRDGRAQCSPRERDDCALTRSCLFLGSCTPKNGTCAMSTADCKATLFCAQHGRCTADEYRGCIAAGTDCETSEDCRFDGGCTAKAGACVPTDETCRKMPGCLDRGACSAVESTCLAGSDEDCRWSRSCIEDGWCVARGRECNTNSAPSCAKTEQCRLHGACAGTTDDCAPASARDCERSVGCAERGECKLIGGLCRKSCAESVECKLRGQCTLDHGRCIAGSDADCRQAAVCSRSGECTRDPKGDCVATRDEDCRPTSNCHSNGTCTAKDGRCATTSDADCARSDSCVELGRCVFRDGTCSRAEQWCRTTAACKEIGHCSTTEFDYRECDVKSDDDCTASEACKLHGWCKAVVNASGRMTCFSREIPR